MACATKTSAADEERAAARENLDSSSQLLDHPGREGLQFDENGMILPHSILGSLEDYRSYLEAKGETELVKRIPKSLRDPSYEAGRNTSDTVEKGTPSGQRNIQGNALKHWDKHMRYRRQQQDFLSDLLHRPVEYLLMNHTNQFRETQEQRGILNQVIPLIHSGYGYHVGGEFWSLPRHYGDEMSGITATLTQTEQGRREPIMQIGQPGSILRETGITHAETVRPASRTWNQSAYLQHQYQQFGEILQEMDIKKPDFSKLEVIGSGKPVTLSTMRQSPLVEKEEEEKESKKKLDPLAQNDDVQLGVQLIPALRFCGELATWTGNSTTKQEVGISATILLEALAGEVASSHLELHNEGSTVIFYSWQQLPLPHSFPNLCSQTHHSHFYFNFSSGAIRPGDTQQLEIIFKSEEPGIRTEIWQLNTHPVLLQGASLQVMFRGISVYQDKTAEERLFLEKKLEKIVQEKICRSILYEVLQGVQSPERPSSPADLYITAEQQFLSKNPKLQYLDEPVEDLKRLWQKMDQESTWDFSFDTLRQAVLALPDEKSTRDSLTREDGLAQLNSMFLQLSEPSELKHHLTAATIGQQLWRKLLDKMTDEATCLRNLLGLPEREMWTGKREKLVITDVDLAVDMNKEAKSEKDDSAARRDERSGGRSGFKDEKSPTGRTVEDNQKRRKRRDDTGKPFKEKQGNESASFFDSSSEGIAQQPPSHKKTDRKAMLIYTRLLYGKVYALVEDLVDKLCDLMDELNAGDKQDKLTMKA